MADQKPQLSFQDIIREEYKKCAASPAYFMKHYVKIQHQSRGTILFNLYPFQEQVMEDFFKFDYNIILKSRQMGISTLVAAYALWIMIFNKDKNILVISLKQEVAKEIITKVRFANDNLPTWLKISCVEDNRLSLKFANGSQIRATATTKKSGVSLSVYYMIIDEAALIDDAEELWASAQPTMATGGKCTILSTPRGYGQFFHKMWTGAEEKVTDGKGTNGFHAIKLPWNLHPDRDDNWRKIEGQKIGSPKQAAREFDCDFETSGDNVIDIGVIEWYKKTMMTEPKECQGIDKGLWIWQYPDVTQSYIVSADTARGDGSDFSGFHVLNLVTLEQCAEYKGQIGTKEYGNLLVATATLYNNAILVPERENVGWATIQAILDKNYPNLFYSSADMKYVDVQRQIVNKVFTDENKMVPGFSTNVKTRQLVISHLEQYCREKQVKIVSKRMLSELETFIWKNGKAEAMSGYNDDLTLALGIGLWVRDTALRLRQEGIDLTKAALGQIGRSQGSDTPFFKVQQAQVGQKAWSMPTGRVGVGQHGTEDLKWLLG